MKWLKIRLHSGMQYRVLHAAMQREEMRVTLAYANPNHGRLATCVECPDTVQWQKERRHVYSVQGFTERIDTRDRNLAKETEGKMQLLCRQPA